MFSKYDNSIAATNYELYLQEADIAVADLSVNKDRQSALDFSMPFMVKII